MLLLLSGCIIFDTSPAQQRLRELTDEDADGSTLAEGDCNDADPRIFPESPEVCDGLDNDCDEDVDEDGGELIWCDDADGDGHGDAATRTNACTLTAGAVTTCDDCDDAVAAVSPDAVERCNGIDDNCDRIVDDPASVDATTWYRDQDGDGYGVMDVTTTACANPEGYADQPEDCDDTDLAVHPDAQEVCNNGLDDDCDGSPGGCGYAGDVVLEPHGVSGVDGGYIAGPLGTGERLGMGAYIIDVTADGRSDIVLSGHGEMYGEEDGGSVHFWYGTPVGYQELTGAGAHLYGPSGLYFGFDNSVLSTDVDGDGVAEILIGGLGPVAGYPDGGAVMRFDPGMSGSRQVTPEDAWISSTRYDEGLGTGLQRADGLMGDGEYLLIGADTNSEVATHNGKYYLVPLDDPEISAATAAIIGTVPWDGVGYQSPPLTDLNGDGFDDLVIGTSRHDDLGTVQVFHGPLAGEYTVDEADTILSLPGDAYFGGSVTTIEGDGGVTSMVVRGDGLPYADSYGAHGAVYILPGDLMGAIDASSEVLATLTGEPERGGGALGLHGADLDGDEIADLVVADPACDGADGAGSIGALYIYHNPFQLRGTQDVWEASDASFHGRTERAGIGSALAIGDANHDGRNDLLFGGSDPETGYLDGGAYFLLGEGM